MEPISKIEIRSTTQLLELANSLSIAITMHIMTPGQASFVWQKHLLESGILPPREPRKTFKKE